MTEPQAASTAATAAASERPHSRARMPPPLEVQAVEPAGCVSNKESVASTNRPARALATQSPPPHDHTPCALHRPTRNNNARAAAAAEDDGLHAAAHLAVPAASPPATSPCASRNCLRRAVQSAAGLLSNLSLDARSSGGAALASPLPSPALSPSPPSPSPSTNATSPTASPLPHSSPVDAEGEGDEDDSDAASECSCVTCPTCQALSLTSSSSSAAAPAAATAAVTHADSSAPDGLDDPDDRLLVPPISLAALEREIQAKYGLDDAEEEDNVRANRRAIERQLRENRELATAARSGTHLREPPVPAKRCPRTGAPVFTWDEIRAHTTAESCWLVVRGVVYDVTPMLSTHPAGLKSILRNAGTDASQHYDFHSACAHKQWKMYEIGLLDGYKHAMACTIQ